MVKDSVLFTKRTEFPKLGYIIHRLNNAGIPSVLDGSSSHAPILRVRKGHENDAWRILDEKASPRSRKTIDDMDDDDKRFSGYGGRMPNEKLWSDD